MMIILIAYLTVVLLLLLFLITMTIYTISLMYSSFKGSPYVATRKKRIEVILEEADLKRNKIFVELGSGDGRIVRTAVKKYGVIGIGADINPLLVLWAKFLTSLDSSFRQKKISFIVENIFNIDLKKVDYVYLFLMPKLIEELEKKFKKELKKGSIVISHGFPLIGWEKECFKTLKEIPFPTYYYKIR